MSTTLNPISLLETIGLSAVQKAADAAFGPGKLTIGDNGSGINLGLPLSSDQSLHTEGLSFGGRLSGRIYIDGLKTDPLKATLFDGFDVALNAFDMTFAQGGLSASNIGGSLTIPFFTNASGQPNVVDIEIATKADGAINISVAAQQSKQGTTSDGLIQLMCPLPGGIGTVEIDVASLEIDKAADGSWAIILSGNLLVSTTAGLNFPTIALQGLGIDTKGHVSLKGGWIDLPSQMALDFFGFHVGLQKLGFGNDDTGRWIGFNGDIHLVEGISLGGSVRGLRINLDTGSVSLDGVSISFEIPDVLSIDGEVDHIHVKATSAADFTQQGLNGSLYGTLASAPGQTVNVDLFAGKVSVNIEAIGGLEVDATFITGTFNGHSVFFLDLDVELPVGIPLFLDVALYGIQGLVATSLEPEPEPARTWWEWYKFKDASDTTTDYSATAVNKWISAYKPGAFAIGGGVTIGTEADDGFTVSAAIMLVVMMPGPVISLIGKANILSKRLKGASEDAHFEAMATYDGNSDTFDLVIQAHYSIPVVLDISATAELYVGGGDWFFAMGKPPRDKRVSARIFDLFETDAYFIVSNRGLVTGTWTGYKNSWSFGPLSASLDAYLATLGAIQWSPFQLGGGIELYGNVHLSAFGIGIGLTADALLEGTAPHPFYVHGELSVELDLPWPLPNVGGTISLSWGGDDGSVPPAPLSLSRVNATMADHCDSTSHPASDSYTLLAHRKQPIQPDFVNGHPLVYDTADKPGILDLQGQSLADWTARKLHPATFAGWTPDANSNYQMAPVVPQDAHLTLNFSHPTQDSTGFFSGAIAYGSTDFPVEVITPSKPDNTLIGADDMSDINPNPPAVCFTIRHSLTEVALYQYDSNNGWVLLYSTASAVPAKAGGPTVFAGVWMQGEPGKSDKKSKMTQLKVIPYSLVTAADGNTVVKRAMLPKAPALYALRAVTQIEAQRVGTSGYQTVPNGNPIIEYTYFQTAAGPGTAIAVPPQPTAPTPGANAAYPKLAANCSKLQQPAAAFPTGGTLDDLETYTQWSWPLDGSTAAYYGYDVAVEFLESYVNELYTRFASRDQPGLHFRCLDRNGRYTSLVPIALEVPSVQVNDALVAAAAVPDLPAVLKPVITFTPIQAFVPLNPVLFHLVTDTAATTSATDQPAAAATASAAASQTSIAEDISATATVSGSVLKAALSPRILPTAALVTNTTPAAAAGASLRSGSVAVGQIAQQISFNPATQYQPFTPIGPIGPLNPGKGIDPGVLQKLLQAQENAAAAEARALWFRPLYPQTQYTLDVVAGSLLRTPGVAVAMVPQTKGGAADIFNAKDAIASLAALKAFYAYEGALTSLKRITFTTSRYQFFTLQMFTVAEQLAGTPGATPIRHYTAAVDPVAWIETNNPLGTAFLNAMTAYAKGWQYAQHVGYTLDPLGDPLSTTTAPAANGNAALVSARQQASAQWATASAASAALFDGLIKQLGRPELASGQPPVTVPDTELSLFQDANGFVVAIMLESPEPLPWQHMRSQNFGLPGTALRTQLPIWNVDGTRGLYLVPDKMRGPQPFNITFVGNLGAALPCITFLGKTVTEQVKLGNIIMGPDLAKWTPPVLQHPILDDLGNLFKISDSAS